MSRDSIKTLGGWIVVLGHLIVLSWTSLSGNLAPEQKRAIAWTLTPVLTIYFVALVKWISSDPESNEARTATDFTIVLTSILVPSILMLTALCLIVSYPSGVADNSDALQQWIAMLEVAMALTVGLVVDDLVPVTRSFKPHALANGDAVVGTRHHDLADVEGAVPRSRATESNVPPGAASRPV